MTPLPRGAWPVMLTPFDAALAVDGAALDAYTDWLIERGAAGLFPVALSGEMYELSEEERLEVAARVVRHAAGRVPVIAAVVAAPAETAASVQRMAATGVDAVVLIASLLLEEGADESALRPLVEEVIAVNPGVALGIYECPIPNHRILSTEAVAWLAGTGSFTFFKETSHDVELMRERVRVAEGTPLQVFNAGIENFTESLVAGVHGLSGWAVNVVPDAVAEIQRLAESGEHSAALALQARVEALETGMGATYPNSAKQLVGLRGGPALGERSRWRDAPARPAQLQALLAATELSAV